MDPKICSRPEHWAKVNSATGEIVAEGWVDVPVECDDGGGGGEPGGLQIPPEEICDYINCGPGSSGSAWRTGESEVHAGGGGSGYQSKRPLFSHRQRCSLAIVKAVAAGVEDVATVASGYGFYKAGVKGLALVGEVLLTSADLNPGGRLIMQRTTNFFGKVMIFSGRVGVDAAENATLGVPNDWHSVGSAVWSLAKDVVPILHAGFAINDAIDVCRSAAP